MSNPNLVRKPATSVVVGESSFNQIAAAIGGGSGGSGGKNYIQNPNFNGNSTTNWDMRKVTLSSFIPTGNLSTAADAGHTISVSGSSTLEGAYSLLVQGSSLFTAGNCLVSDAFTIDREDQAKVLGWSFSYEAITTNMDFSGTTANTWAVYIAEVSAASGAGANTVTSWIQPAGVYNLVQGSGVGLASGTFQTTATGTQYRIAVVCITATSGAVEMRFDDFQLGPQKVLQGPSGPVGEIIAFGSLTPPTGFLYCDGSAVSRTQYADLFKAISTTYGVGDGSTTFNLPNLKGVFARGAGSQTISGVTYTGTLGSSQVDQMQGHYHNKAAIDDTNYRLLNVSTSGGVDANDGAPNFTTVAASSALNITSPSTDGTNGTPRTGSETRPANVAVAYHIRYLATYQMSNDTDTRVVAARAVLTTAGTTLNGNAYNRLNYNSVQYDTHSAITTGAGVWKYTIPIGGYYKIGASINTGAVVPATYCQILMTPVINGVVNSDVVLSHIRQSTISFNKPSGSTQYKFNAGDYFYIQSICDNPVNSATLNEPETGWVTVERLSGPATIAASETVAASYNSSTTVFPVGPSETTIVNPNKVYDSHNAYNSSTGIYTVPISGKYRLTSYVYSGSSATNTIASQILIRLFRGLTSDVVIASNFYQTTNSIFAWVGGSVSIAANAGEQLSLKVGLTTGAAGFTANGNLNTFFMIERIGN